MTTQHYKCKYWLLPALNFFEFDCPCLLFTDTRVHHFTRCAGFTAGHRLSQHHALWISLCSAVPPLHCLLPHSQSKTPLLLPLFTPFLLPSAFFSVMHSVSSMAGSWSAATSLAAWHTALHSRQQWLCSVGRLRGKAGTLHWLNFKFGQFDFPPVAVNSLLF